MADTVRVVIPEEHERSDVPDMLRHIADLIEDDYREGYHPRWELQVVEHSSTENL